MVHIITTVRFLVLWGLVPILQTLTKTYLQPVGKAM